MSDLRETFIAWELGWAASRDLPPAHLVEGGMRIECRQQSRDVEIFALHADDDPDSLVRLAELLRAETESAWLTVPTREPERAAATLEAAGLEFVSRVEALMETDLRTQPVRAVAAPYRLHTEVTGPVVHVSVEAADGEEAARGYAGLIGTAAVADRILTAEAHRRRSLGAAVMTALADAAVTAGATRGLLIGSVEGQALYRSLGWSTVATVLIAKLPE
ncbi:GNAT superfamily N-acetyltransferase [Allocatelliglobosispora scoriae]|uniref:GNAT superfamily N-acetyltransferase n=1 Tax=Allocatelliglobosispora scoriae TaxID=643052 RepID=A0A841BIN2_9ACTN|nr:GNAT family N-acetyltransferase [Allocatelliglobosispora scoriae]MBB5868124.1 GNAT superfamily N-acetyltransferase [Allocatelliglobosispora scoriae]